jgi:polysaccharide export outer membrane protein
MLNSKYFLSIALLAALAACKSTQPNDLIMFNDLNAGKTLTDVEINKTNYETYIIEPENTVNIVVSSSNVMDFQLKDQFNLLPVTSLDPMVTRVGEGMSFQNYRVDDNGYINYPVFGKIKVAGLTNIEVEELMLEKLKQRLSAPLVKVYVQKEPVKVFGEVMTPGSYNLMTMHYSIIDVLAAAGGILETGDKKHVKVVREENGKVNSVVLDLTSTDIFSSPYFYVKQRDIIVVDPNGKRKKDSQYGVSDNYRLSLISTIISTISLLSSIAIVALNNK